MRRSTRAAASAIVCVRLFTGCSQPSWTEFRVPCEGQGVSLPAEGDLERMGQDWDTLTAPWIGSWAVEGRWATGEAATGTLTVVEDDRGRRLESDCGGPNFALRTDVRLTLDLGDGVPRTGTGQLRWYEWTPEGPGSVPLVDPSGVDAGVVRVGLAARVIDGTAAAPPFTAVLR